MTTEEIINSFKDQTGISVIRASKEGVLKEYSVETEYPEILGAMLATVYGASVTAIIDFSGGEDPTVTIQSGNHHIMIVSSRNDIVAAFVPNGNAIPENDIRLLAEKLIAVEN